MYAHRWQRVGAWPELGLVLLLIGCGNEAGVPDSGDAFMPVAAGDGASPSGGLMSSGGDMVVSGGVTVTGGVALTGGTGSFGGAGTEAPVGPAMSGSGGGTVGSPPPAGANGSPGMGTCCPNGDCLCHGPDPLDLTSARGPFATADYGISTGTVYYPMDAEPPFAAVALCGGFLNAGPEMAAWGPFYASHGIVTVIVSTGTLDFPDVRARSLGAAIDELKTENNNSSSPLYGKLSGRYGTSGYSMGGGGTTIAATSDSTLRTSVGLAPWGGTGQGVEVPTLVLCGSSDVVAPCSMSQGVYSAMPNSTPKMIVTISGVTHFDWFGPTTAGRGASGAYALAFQKVFLEGDERWKPLLLQSADGTSQDTNIN